MDQNLYNLLEQEALTVYQYTYRTKTDQKENIKCM